MPTLLNAQPAGLLEAVLDDVGVALAIIDKTGKVVLANKTPRARTSLRTSARSPACWRAIP